MKLTNFGSVVKTYKKNFLIRKEKFIAERKALQEKKKKDREDLIEAQKEVAPLIKLKGNQSKKINFLGDIKKFLGFMLAGFILQNLKNIIPILQEIYKKIEDLVKGTKEFVEGVIGGLQSFFNGLDGAKQKMDDLISPILNADLSQFVPFQNELEKVLTGVLSIAGIITGLYAAGQSDDATKRDTPLDTAGQGALTSARRRSQALQNARKLRIERQAQRVAARKAAEEAAATQAAKEAAERLRRVEKVFGQQTPAGVRTSGGTGAVYSRGVINPSDKDFAAIIKKQLEKLDNKQLADMLFFDEKADPQARKIAGEIIDERLKKQVYFTSDDLKKKDLTRSIFDENTPRLKTKKFLKPEVPSTTPSPTNVNKFNQVLKNAKGFIKPSNLAKMGKFAKDFGAGVAIEFFAGWAVDRGLEAMKLDEKSLLQQRLLRFNQLPIDRQKEIIEKYNQSLENELNYQKQFFGIRAGIDKFLALGDMTINEKKIKALTSFLTAVSISGAPSVYDLASAAIPDYLGVDVDTTLPSTSKISSPSVLPPLPPTGTLGTGAQAYGASRDGGKRRHAGVDFDPANDKNSKFYSRIGGEVIYAANAGGGYGNVVDIYNAELGVTERIAEGDRIHVKKGDIVKPGTLVQSGSTMTGVFHYEIRKGIAGHSGAFEGTLDPLKFLEKLKSNGNQASIKTSPSSLISSAGLNQSTTYSSAGMSVRREVNNIFVPIAA